MLVFVGIFSWSTEIVFPEIVIPSPAVYVAPSPDSPTNLIEFSS